MKKLTFLLLFVGSSILAQTDAVKFRATIANRNTDSLTIVGPNGFKRVMTIGKDGRFADSFSVNPGIYQFYDGVETSLMYLQNGFDLNLAMDAKRFDESIVYTGKGELENNFFAQKALIDEQLEIAMETIKDEAEFKLALENRNASLQAKLQADGFDPTFKANASKMVTSGAQQMAAMFTAAQAKARLAGAMSPQFDFENHKGGRTKLSDLKGKYVYIDNWATWCGPCRAEIPSLKMVEEKYHDKAIEFVSISVDTKKDYEKWKKFVTDKQLGGLQLFSDNDWNSDFIRAFGITSIPRFILIGPDGKVIDADAKRPSDPALIAQLDTLLK
ncbi:MAG TPA: TlpA disulfide reductase family protein [Flavobacterium sp.]|jgi:thiol-disulfide isomerase/thioredoxin